jgi:thiamine-monophosphate kinase
MDEFELIDRYFRRTVGHGVALGIGDDGAVLNVPNGRQLVAVVDTTVAGVHYPDNLPAADIGYRAVAVNLSDIAAMGATPSWMTLALTLPASDPDWLEQFASGMFAAADAYGVALVGGDTTRGSQTVVSVQLLGHAASHAILKRSGARPGDGIYVSGTLGDAAAGLQLLQKGEAGDFLKERFRRPEARVTLGQAVASIAGAAIDISDGLAADLDRILTASGVGATVDRQALPLSAELLAWAGADEARRLALTGGDDYELCLAVPAVDEAEFQRLARQAGVSVTRIGVAEATPGLRISTGGADVRPLKEPGFRHF